MQDRIQKLIDNGVKFLNKDQVYIGENVEIGSNTVIYPFVHIDDNVQIGQNCIVQNSTMIINNIKIFDHVFIGPFSLLRQDVSIGTNSSIGPHCEVVRSKIGANCKIGHKNFIGDATLFDNVKFGAGAIIANSNWETTFKTIIGSGSLIGCNVTIIAPIEIGENALVAAGSTINKNVADNELAIARSRQENKERKK